MPWSIGNALGGGVESRNGRGQGLGRLPCGRRQPLRNAVMGRHPAGIVLIMVLILLVTMAVSAAVAIRLARTDELISGNVHANQLAFRAAQNALSLCESHVRAGTFQLTESHDGQAWSRLENWTGSGIHTVALNEFHRQNGYAGDLLPSCMVEDVTHILPTAMTDTEKLTEIDRGGRLLQRAYQITARGYSPDFGVLGGQPESGAQVWLQEYVLHGSLIGHD